MSKERDKMKKKDGERISAVCPCRVPPLMVVHHRVRYKVEGRRGGGGMGNSFCVCVCNCVCVIVVMCLPLCETCQRVCGVMRVESERRPAALPPTGCRHNRSPLFCPRYIYYVYIHNVDSCKRRDVAFTIYTELFHSCPLKSQQQWNKKRHTTWTRQLWNKFPSAFFFIFLMRTTKDFQCCVFSTAV